ncbi:hypothetical protein Dcar01_00608 [Deinococcus carri]|uniref:Uncharacterized protein n=1 Tax=Deinococcus carri TaxID=1211323 RepID=A0ABP9W3G8_9DEIO
MVALLGAALAGVLPGNPAGDTAEEAQRQAAIAAIDQVRSRTERMLGKPGATIQTAMKAECGGRLTK